MSSSGRIVSRALALLLLFTAGCSRDPRSRFDARVTELISPQRIQRQLAELTIRPHRAGTEGNRMAGDAILRRLREAEYQPDVAERDARLHEPIASSLQILSPESRTLTLQEKVLSADTFTSVAASEIPYLAYVRDFDVSGEVVYANYGSREDYEVLKKQGVSLPGKIALVRAQGSCRGMKGMIAEEEQLAGLLLYPELKDMGFTYPPYPDGRHINPWTVERGSMLRYFLYPGEPKVPEAGMPGSTMPTIPALPISEEVAETLLKLIKGPAVPPAWKGMLNAEYSLGLHSPTVRMTFRGNLAERKIRNITASIPGTHTDEPRVLIGCHYDAWVYGAADPSSATAVVLEVADALSALHKKGWKPRRGIQFAFWDAEEFGMIGSTRWVEDNLQELRNHVSVYLSVDTAVRAKDFTGNIQPGLRGALDDALSRVPDPATGTKLSEVRGALALPGFSGDVAPFTSLAGIPTGEIAFGRFYPVYHSLYDNYRWFEKFADPGFKYSATLARILALYASAWANDLILPYRFTEVAEYAGDFFNAITQKHPAWRNTESWKALDAQIRDFHRQAERMDSLRGRHAPEDAASSVNAHLHEAFLSFSDARLDFSVRNLLIGPAKETGCDPSPLPALQRAETQDELDHAAASLAAAFQNSTTHIKAAADLLEQ